MVTACIRAQKAPTTIMVSAKEYAQLLLICGTETAATHSAQPVCAQLMHVSFYALLDLSAMATNAYQIPSNVSLPNILISYPIAV